MFRFKPEMFKFVDMSEPRPTCRYGPTDYQAKRIAARAQDLLEEDEDKYIQALFDIQKFVDEQAEDEGLWSVPAEGQQSIGEAMLQQALRALHAKIENYTEALDL